MKTFKQFQEAAFAIPAAAGILSKVLPAAAATIGAVGTYMQARRVRKNKDKTTAVERWVFDRNGKARTEKRFRKHYILLACK